MKKQKFNILTYSRPALFLLVLWFWGSLPVGAQTTISEGQVLQTFTANGQYQDVTIPIDVKSEWLYLEVKGGDGGTSSLHPAGAGATAKAFFKLGNDKNEVPPGSTIRLVPGQKGQNANGASGADSGSGGGGGSAVLLLRLGKTDWKEDGEILLVGGGGAGAGARGDGIEANTGSKGTGGKTTNGGALNNGGGTLEAGGATPCASGGGSAIKNAAAIMDEECDYEDDVQAKVGFPSGGLGAHCFRNGGWGFGGGGSGNTGGGGGGGYSGGGGGSSQKDNDVKGHGGGGGGSFIDEYFSMKYNDISSNGSTSIPRDGYVMYGLVNLTSIPGQR